jgi:hypothetical protein
MCGFFADSTRDGLALRTGRAVISDIVRRDEYRTSRRRAICPIRGVEFFRPTIKGENRVIGQQMLDRLHIDRLLTAPRGEQSLLSNCVLKELLETVFTVCMLAEQLDTIGNKPDLSTDIAPLHLMIMLVNCGMRH